jgi:hypothetical protein
VVYVVSEALACAGRAAQLSIDSGFPIRAATTMEAMSSAPSRMAVNSKGSILS